MSDIQAKVDLANQEVQKLAASKTLDASSLQQIMVADSLQVAILTDGQGTVISQPSQPNLTGYPLTAEFPWFSPDQKGITVPLDGVPVAVASSANLLVGYRLDSSYLRQEGSHGYAAISDGQGKLVSSSAGNDAAVCLTFLKQHQLRPGKTDIWTGTVNGQAYLLLAEPLTLEEGGQPDYLLLLHHV